MKLVTFIISATILCSAQGTELRRGLKQKQQQANKNNGGGGGTMYSNASPSSLGSAEIEDLKFMREEEKMARDLYRTFYQQWGIRAFDNVGNSEQHHMDMVLDMLQVQGIQDPANGLDRGVFTQCSESRNICIQDVYNELVALGSKSVTDALKVAGKVEEIDIQDLMFSMEHTAVPDLDVLYGRLLRASENHLRAFARVLESLGEPYVAQVLDDDDVDSILGR